MMMHNIRRCRTNNMLAWCRLFAEGRTLSCSKRLVLLHPLPAVAQAQIMARTARTGTAAWTGSSASRSSSSSSSSSSPSPSHKSYTHTIHLPKTQFPLRIADFNAHQSKYIARCTTELYGYASVNADADADTNATTAHVHNEQHHSSRSLFLLHDGPPYANGSLHCGHFLNKVLKDFIVRYKFLRGFRVSFIPGWDCHGLPIEMKALEQLSQQQQLQQKPQQETQPRTKNEIASISTIRQCSETFARDTVEAQRATFQSWAVMADWSAGYKTLDREYESLQVRVFGKMAQRGLIYQGFKPVHWSPSSRTALAESELEYSDDHVSDSVFVSFPMFRRHQEENTRSENSTAPLSLNIRSDDSHGQMCQWPFGNVEAVDVIIWTTTPWTLPANVAVCYHPQEEYCLMSSAQAERCFLVAAGRVPALTANGVLPADSKPTQAINGAALAGLHAMHPWIEDRSVPLLEGMHVTVDGGTGLVHTAPGHGVDDFEVGQAHGLDVLVPVNDSGKLTAAAGPDLQGLCVLDRGEANAAVIDLLSQRQRLLLHEPYKHRYPYDWRTKQPVILRATLQWFADLSVLQEEAMAALKDVHISEPSHRVRIESMISSRTQWCISRQRSWGVPIPAFRHVETNEYLMTDASLSHIADLFAEHGSDCWWTLPLCELLAPVYRDDADKWVRVTDTMDVWFDSGVSWYAALHPRGIAAPADVYLEGSDQHRGWFQSSLLTSVAVTGAAPYRKLITHGFVLDQELKKMSKSVGNMIVPSDVISGTGRTHPAQDALCRASKCAQSSQVALSLSVEKENPVEQAVLVARSGAHNAKNARFTHDSQPETETLTVKEMRALRKEQKKAAKRMKRQRKKEALRDGAAAVRSPSASFEKPNGLDVLRVWVAMSDYTKDVSISSRNVEQAAEVVRKFRGTIRFLLGCLSDFTKDDMCSGQEALRSVDHFILSRLHLLGNDVTEAYDDFNFVRVTTLVNNFCVTVLSSLYFDISKDRLYVARIDDPDRRSCQFVLFCILRVLSSAMSPIIPLTAEEVFDHVPDSLKSSFGSFDADTEAAASPSCIDDSSIFRSISNGHNMVPPKCWTEYSGLSTLEAKWQTILAVRTLVTQTLENARVGSIDGLGVGGEAIIASSLEADVSIEFTPETLSCGTLESLTEDEWAELCIVSTMRVVVHGQAVEEAEAAMTYQVSEQQSDDGIGRARGTARGGGQVEVVIIDGNVCYRRTVGITQRHSTAGHSLRDEQLPRGCISIIVSRSRQGKCARCWKMRARNGQELCARCESVLLMQH